MTTRVYTQHLLSKSAQTPARTTNVRTAPAPKTHVSGPHWLIRSINLLTNTHPVHSIPDKCPAGIHQAPLPKVHCKQQIQR